MSSGSQRPPAPLFLAACCTAAGIFLADQVASLPGLCSVLAPAALAYALLAPGRLAWLALLLVTAGTLHHWQRERSPSREFSRRVPAGENKPVLLTGTVLDIPEQGGRHGVRPRSHFLFKLATAEPEQYLLPGARLLIHASGASPRCGEQLRLRAAVRRIPPARNPGQSDTARVWERRGVWVEAFVSNPHDSESLSAPVIWEPRQWAASVRLWIADALSRGIENHTLEHALISSMVLGVRGHGLREAEAWFRETGTLHLFAVSGLNLSMLAGLLSTGCRIAGAGQRLTALVTLPVLAAYAVVVGLGPSCLRAFIGALLLLGCVWAERPSVAYNTIGAAALLLLFADTNTLFHGGFQLSFCLVLALLWIALPLGSSMAALFQPDPLLPRTLWSRAQRWRVRAGATVSATVAASLVTFVGTIPWSLLMFHMVSPVGIALNLLAIPLSFGILSLGLLSVFSTPLGPVAPWLNGANALLAGLLLELVHLGSALPGGHWSVASPFVKRPDFVVFDAGDGAALLLDLQGKPWLLDCGNAEQFEHLVRPGLRFFGLNRLEGLLLSHGDAAHIGGALAALAAFQPNQFVDPAAKDRSRTRKQLAAKLEASGVAPRHVGAGDTLQRLPAPKVEILYPPQGSLASLADDKGLVVHFRTQRWSLLYTADAGYPTERWLLEHCPSSLQADIWVRGSHTREVTGTDAFVQAVNPALVVVAGTPFGRDTAATRRWAEQWRARGRTIWLQQETGAVLGWGGDERRVRGFLDGREFRW